MAEKSTFDNIWTRIGGRKLIAFSLGLAAILALAFTGHLSETAMWAILGLAACFSGGNAMEHMGAAMRVKAALLQPNTSVPTVTTPAEAGPDDEE